MTCRHRYILGLSKSDCYHYLLFLLRKLTLIFAVFFLRKMLLQQGLNEEVSNAIYDVYDKYHGKILEHMEATGSYTTIDFIGNAFII